jgi:hypothetical protein
VQDLRGQIPKVLVYRIGDQAWFMHTSSSC